MHFTDIMTCTSGAAFEDEAPSTATTSATTTMVSAGSETTGSFTNGNGNISTSKRWRPRALSPLRVPRSLSLRPENGADEMLSGDLPQPILRVSSRPTTVQSPAQPWSFSGRTMPSLDGMISDTEEEYLGLTPIASRISRPGSPVVPLDAAALAMEMQAFETEPTAGPSSQPDTIEYDAEFASEDYESQIFNVRLDPHTMTTCNVVRPAPSVHLRRLRKCLSVPRDLGRAFQSFSCFSAENLEDQVDYESPKSAAANVFSFEKAMSQQGQISDAPWASIFGLLEAPWKRRYGVFGNFYELQIENGSLIMPTVQIAVKQDTYIKEVEGDDTTPMQSSFVEVGRP